MVLRLYIFFKWGWAVVADDDEVRITFRMPKALRDRVSVAAENNNRSMNAEIIEALEIRYPQPKFSLDQFFNDRYFAIVAEADKAIRDKMIVEANETLQENGRTDLSIWVDSHGGKDRVQFGSMQKSMSLTRPKKL